VAVVLGNMNGMQEKEYSVAAWSMCSTQS